jgi:phosphoribosylformylglycinamidine synthase II
MAMMAEAETARASVTRIEVRAADGVGDPRGAALRARIAAAGLGAPERVTHVAVYLIRGLDDAAVAERVARELLADPVTQRASVAAEAGRGASSGAMCAVEVHPLPGVMDPAAESVRAAVAALTGADVEVRTGDRYEFDGMDAAAARAAVESLVANTVIHAVHAGTFHPADFVRGTPYQLRIREVKLTGLGDAELEKLSREAHLFLSLDEMRAVQAEYARLGREPREIELETIAQTWSEHCVHKTLKATVRYRPSGPDDLVAATAEMRPGHEPQSDGSVIIRNLLKSTVAAATHELTGQSPMRPGPGVDTQAKPIDWCLSVFSDNSGVIAFDESDAVCIKVETHNHPSAIEPYGGAATGIGGCIRDVIGTGRGAKPIAATDVFCVAHPVGTRVPRGCLPPSRVLPQVVAGVRDYGNRMGIPTLSGSVWFDDRYIGNPLVYCGCIGMMPSTHVKGQVLDGDVIVAVGGRTGRDGIHGATFSSAELTDTHADEFSHAVQIGNAITEKTLLDAILVMRDDAGGCLYRGLTDCGAGGFSSAVGEMGSEIGAEVHLERAPTKYDGLSPTEVWISEAQERMVLAVPPAALARVRAICADHGVECCELGTFGTPSREIILRWHGTEVGRLDCGFLHGGIPMPTRDAAWEPLWAREHAGIAGAVAEGGEIPRVGAAESITDALRALLSHPNIASKAWIIRQYDHEVQGTSVVKPLVGVGAGGPGDASVIAPKAGSMRGVGIACGLATGLAADPYVMGLAAIDECVRNLVCTGVDPSRIAILDNFCWPSCGDPRNLASLVRAAEACYDGAKAYRTPFVSGKDSLNNQFVAEGGRVIRIPPTLLITGMGIVADVTRCVTMDAKGASSGDATVLVIVGETGTNLGGSHWSLVAGLDRDGALAMPRVDLERGPAIAAAVAKAIRSGFVRSAHDPSEGGLLVAAAEMAFSGGCGVHIDLRKVPLTRAARAANELLHGGGGGGSTAGHAGHGGAAAAHVRAVAFAEDPSRYLLEVRERDLPGLRDALGDVPHATIGRFDESGEMVIDGGAAAERISVDALRAAWESSWQA